MGSCFARTAGIVAAGLTLAVPAFAECLPDRAELSIPDGSTGFTVEVADTNAERSQGLMFREKMADDAGMLFVYQRPQHTYFWMRNTLIPLDMIFADPQGQVTRVHANAVPGDETAIDGGRGVKYVLEINGGRAAALGIKPGSLLRHPAIDQARALWPCTDP